MIDLTRESVLEDIESKAKREKYRSSRFGNLNDEYEEESSDYSSEEYKDPTSKNRRGKGKRNVRR